MLKLMLAFTLYISITRVSCKRILNCVMSSRACVHCEVLDGRAGLNRGIPIMTHG